MLPDRWNPRLWLRDWLLKPGVAEEAQLSERIGTEARTVIERELQPEGILAPYVFAGPVNTHAQGPFVVGPAGVTVRTDVDGAGRIFAAGMGSVPPPATDDEGGADAA